MTYEEIAGAVQCIEDRVTAAYSAVIGISEMTDVQRDAERELMAAKALLYVVNEHLQKNEE